MGVQCCQINKSIKAKMHDFLNSYVVVKIFLSSWKNVKSLYTLMFFHSKKN